MAFLRDTWLIFERSVLLTSRNLFWIFVTLFTPFCYFLLFAPLLEKLAGIPGFSAGNSLTVFTPGLLMMVALYGTAFVGYGLVDDIRAGILERFRVTPVNRLALLLGRVLCNLVALVLQALLIFVLARLFGLSAPLGGMLLTLGLVILVGLTTSVISYSSALILQTEDSLSAFLNFLLLPLQLLAGIMLPLALAPRWLQTIALFNPLAHAVTAARALFIGNYTDIHVFIGFAVMSVTATIAFLFSAHLFKKSAE